MQKHLLLIYLVLLFWIPLPCLGIEPSASLQSTIRTLQPGQSVTYPDTLNSAPSLLYTIVTSGPPLLMSDDPESVNASGICARENIGAETARIYMYNVNNTLSDNFKITCVLQNLSTQPETVTIKKKGVLPPGTSYRTLGKTNLYSFYTSSLNEQIVIPSMDSVILDSTWETYSTKRYYLAHGIYEIYATQSTRISICALPFNANTLNTYSSLSALIPLKKNAGRGLFPNTDRLITLNTPYNTAYGVQRIALADWGVHDPWVTGMDDITYTAVTNVGNYGVMYTINMPMVTSDNRDMAIIVMSPPADSCHYAGVIGTNADYNESTSGYFYTPSDMNEFTNSTTGSLVGIYSLTSTTRTITIQFSPPGSSCLPADLLLIPIPRLSYIDMEEMSVYGDKGRL